MSETADGGILGGYISLCGLDSLTDNELFLFFAVSGRQAGRQAGEACTTGGDRGYGLASLLRWQERFCLCARGAGRAYPAQGSEGWGGGGEGKDEARLVGKDKMAKMMSFKEFVTQTACLYYTINISN